MHENAGWNDELRRGCLNAAYLAAGRAYLHSEPYGGVVTFVPAYKVIVYNQLACDPQIFMLSIYIVLGDFPALEIICKAVLIRGAHHAILKK